MRITKENKKDNVADSEKVFTNLGLTKDQALVYKAVMELGSGRVHTIALKSGVKRTLAYKVLSQLEEYGIVESKVAPGEKVLKYSPTHPSNLEVLVRKRKDLLQIAENSFNDVIGDLTSSYNIANSRPNLRFFEGIDGIKKLYEEILKDRNDMILLRSYLDKNLPILDEILLEHIINRAKKNIHTQAITPLNLSVTKDTISYDEKNLVTRRFLKEENFSLPAQIIVYGNKVALTSYKTHIITTIIDSPDISDSFKVIFKILWGTAVEPKDALQKYKSYDEI